MIPKYYKTLLHLPWSAFFRRQHDVFTNNTTANTDADSTTGIRKLFDDYFGCSENENKININISVAYSGTRTYNG